MSPSARLVVRAGAAGAAVAACWLPIGAAPLLPLALLLALRTFRRVDSGRDAVLFGVVYAASRYAVASHFLLALLRYSPLAIAFYVLAIAFILPYGVLEAWGAYTLETRGGLPRSLGFGMLYAVGEWLRSLGDLSFPADLLANGAGTSPAWLGLSGIIGPFGFTLVAFLAAAIADLAIEALPQRRRAVSFAAAAIGVWMLAPAWDAALRANPGDEGPRLRVAVVQPSIGVEEKIHRENWPALRERLWALTAEAAKGADLVVWPESSRPGPLVWSDTPELRDEEMERLAARVGVPILYGCELARVTGGDVQALYNAAVLVTPQGGVQWYGKQHLLPLAEGVPFARYCGWGRPRHAGGPVNRSSLLTMLGHFAPGPGPAVFKIGSAKIGVLICYEGMYPSLGRGYRAAGADALFVLTNDSWWGRSVFPAWHARMVAARARELDLPVLRAANSGVSSMIDRFGTTRASTSLGATTILRATISSGPSASTLYARFGDLAIGAALFVLGAAVLRALANVYPWRIVVRARGTGLPRAD